MWLAPLPFVPKYHFETGKRKKPAFAEADAPLASISASATEHASGSAADPAKGLEKHAEEPLSVPGKVKPPPCSATSNEERRSSSRDKGAIDKEKAQRYSGRTKTNTEKDRKPLERGATHNHSEPPAHELNHAPKESKGVDHNDPGMDPKEDDKDTTVGKGGIKIDEPPKTTNCNCSLL